MKICLCLIFLCSYALYAQPYANNRLLNGLKGSVLLVKSVAWSPDPADSTRWVKAESGLPAESDYTFYFDANGNRYYALFADETGENEEILLSFDSLCRIVSQRSRMLSDGGPVSQIDYYFDENGHLVKEIIRTDSVVIEERMYECDRFGRVIAETIIPDVSIDQKHSVYATDSTGILSKTVFANDPYDREFIETIQRWDTLGREIYYFLQGGADSRPVTEVYYTWNDQNQLTTLVQPFQFGPEWRQVYLYDANGNETEIREYNGEKLIMKTRMYYNYDSLGNWVEKIVLKNDVLQYCIRREITYEKDH